MKTLLLIQCNDNSFMALTLWYFSKLKEEDHPALRRAMPLDVWTWPMAFKFKKRTLYVATYFSILYSDSLADNTVFVPCMMLCKWGNFIQWTTLVLVSVFSEWRDGLIFENAHLLLSPVIMTCMFHPRTHMLPVTSSKKLLTSHRLNRTAYMKHHFVHYTKISTLRLRVLLRRFYRMTPYSHSSKGSSCNCILSPDWHFWISTL